MPEPTLFKAKPLVREHVYRGYKFCIRYDADDQEYEWKCTIHRTFEYDGRNSSMESAIIEARKRIDTLCLYDAQRRDDD